MELRKILRISRALFGLCLATGLMACDADEPPNPGAVRPTSPRPTAADYTPALSGRAASEHFQIDFSVSALSTGRTAQSDNYELRLGETSR